MATLLSKIANNLSIDNGNIESFVNGVVNRSCNGGLFSYTTKNNFRRANTINNYEAGSVGRYRYSDYGGTDIFETTFGRFPMGVGNGYGISRLNSDFIGDGYTVSLDNVNSPLKFVTLEDFDDFEYLLREETLARNYDELYNVSKYDDNAKFITENYEKKASSMGVSSFSSSVFYTPRGTQYTINHAPELGENHENLETYGERFRAVANTFERIVKDRMDKLDSYLEYERREDDINPDHPFDNRSNYTDLPPMRQYLPSDNLYQTRDWVLASYDNFRIGESEFIKLKTEATDAFPVDLYNYGEEEGLPDDLKSYLAEQVNGLELVENGVLEYYNEERNKYKSKFPGIRYPSAGVYSWTKQYGVYSSEDTPPSYYDIDEDYAFSGAVIDNSFKGGNFRGKRIYSYMQEAEQNGVPTLTSVSTTDNSTVVLDSFDTASRLIKNNNELFRNKKVGSLINRFHTASENFDPEGDYDIISAYDKRYGMSRGRNLLTKSAEDGRGADMSTGYENPYCRVWTAHHQYAKLKDRIRPFYDDANAKSIKDLQSNYGGLRPFNGATRLNDYSVLKSNGYLRITPTQEHHSQKDIRKYMFSIENLAWKDSGRILSEEQKGPNNGRIMWFPPYNLDFSEQISTNWNANQFIGRGEQIYTYVNTERMGTLSFTLLIDHPAILNKWALVAKNDTEKEKRQNDILRYFAGCGDIDVVTDGELNEWPEDEPPIQNEANVDPVPIPEGTKYIGYTVFFPNNFTSKDFYSEKEMEKAISRVADYETLNAKDHVYYEDEELKNKVYKNDNVSLFNLNEAPSEDSISYIKKMLMAEYGNDIEVRPLMGDKGLVNISKEFSGDTIFGLNAQTMKIDKIFIRGFASSHGKLKNNIALTMRRRAFIKNVAKYKGGDNIPENAFNELDGSILKMNDDDKGSKRDINALEAKVARAAIAVVKLVWKNDNSVSTETGNNEGTYMTASGITMQGSNALDTAPDEPVETTPRTVTRTTVEAMPAYMYNNEYKYFKELEDGNSDLVYKNIVDKVKYFDPAFHSITPEGFNARLTFLHQCTRQGPTNSVSQASSGSRDYIKYAGNLAFGRAPYCILRIGDFFHTKICIDSVNISYKTGQGIQWDLNPEGAGVQPMFADVNINFKFIGGQDIGGSIEVLQNAVSSNYYANASIYDPSARRYQSADANQTNVNSTNAATVANNTSRTSGQQAVTTPITKEQLAEARGKVEQLTEVNLGAAKNRLQNNIAIAQNRLRGLQL